MQAILAVFWTYVFLQLLIWGWQYLYYGATTRRRKKLREGPIKFAVAVPAHNEGMTIARTVKSFLEAGMRPEDIFVLPNGCRSDDCTAEVARGLGVQVPKIPVRGKEETLNYAIHDLHLFEKYTHVCFFDADTEVDHGYFEVTRQRIKHDPTLDSICGKPKSLRYDPPADDPAKSRSRTLRQCINKLIGRMLTAHRAVQYWQFHAVHKAAQGKIGSILVVPGCAGTYSMKVLREVRWSGDTRIGDMDMTIECALRGKKIVFEPKAIVYTQDPTNFHDYVFQLYKRWYRGLWMNMGKHGLLWKGWLSLLHWDCRLMFLDQFSIFLAPVAIWLLARLSHWPYPISSAVIVFLCIATFETVACAFVEKRWDILPFVITFPFLRLLDSVLFLASMPSIRVKREKSGEWASPKRYLTLRREGKKGEEAE